MEVITRGLRNLKADGGMDSYIEKVIENAVYKHLCYLGYDVKVGVLVSLDCWRRFATTIPSTSSAPPLF